MGTPVYGHRFFLEGGKGTPTHDRVPARPRPSMAYGADGTPLAVTPDYFLVSEESIVFIYLDPEKVGPEYVHAFRRLPLLNGKISMRHGWTCVLFYSKGYVFTGDQDRGTLPPLRIQIFHLTVQEQDMCSASCVHAGRLSCNSIIWVLPIQMDFIPST